MKKVLLIAIMIYVIIIAAGATVYFMFSEPPAPPPARAAETSSNMAKDFADRMKDPADTKSSGTMKKESQSGSRQTADAIIAGMKVENRGGITLYTYDYPKRPTPGVYLRPFLVTDGVEWVLKFDLYYYYNISDPQKTAWIHGDALNVNIDGKISNLHFLPHDRRDKMSPDAENLAESYVHDATEEEVAILRSIAHSQTATITYYQADGSVERSHTLTLEEIRRIRNVLDLYDGETKEDV